VTRQTAALPILIAFLVAACRQGSPLVSPRPDVLALAAPDSFDVYVETTRGPFVIRARREWSPLGVDRFHYLVRHGFYDDARFFRVVQGFVAQFGLPGRPPMDSLWQARRLPDEPVRATNRRGAVAYARGGPDTRSIQLYINLADNTPRLDTLNAIGFPPIGEVLIGMAEVVDSLYAGYGGTREQRLPGPSQDSIRVAGNAYLDREFPLLDRILQARVIRDWSPLSQP
jgi:peptidyl-prolyl cis-trans isomerase A (cyclophilin A)